jgi:stress response protein YsnF
MDPYDLDEAIGSDAYDPDGAKVGRIGQVYVDDQTDEPTWASVRTGLFGTRESFVPLDGATFDGGRLTVAYPKDRIKDAPTVDADGHLSPEEEDELYAYYASTGPDDSTGTDPATGTERVVPAQTTGPDATGSTDDAITRSEERLQVGTTSGVAGRARLRKYVVVEEEQVTVPVRREKVVLETPGTDSGTDTGTDTGTGTGTGTVQTSHAEGGSGASSGAGEPVPAAGDADQDAPEMILHEERPVVSTETVPVERVRLDTVEETVEERVTEPVRKERVALEEDVPPSTGG